MLNEIDNMISAKLGIGVVHAIGGEHNILFKFDQLVHLDDKDNIKSKEEIFDLAYKKFEDIIKKSGPYMDLQLELLTLKQEKEELTKTSLGFVRYKIYYDMQMALNKALKE